MNDDSTIRRDNLRSLRLTPAQLIERCGRTYTYWRDLLSTSKKSFGEKVARSIEGDLNLPRGWLDEPHGPSAAGVEVPLVLKESQATYSATPAGASIEVALAELHSRLADAPPEAREAIAMNLAGWARQGGGDHWMRSLVALLNGTSRKQTRTGTE